VATAPLAWGRPHNGLRVGIAQARAGEARLTVALENVGKDDLVVNLGIMLANGKKQFPLALRLTLTDAKGARWGMRLPQPAVAGRVDPFIVPLPARARYSLRYDLGDLIEEEPGGAGAPPTGRCRAAVEFVGKAVTRERTNADTPGLALMTYWTGAVQSQELQLTLPFRRGR
jgi:hypothetical protein